MKKIDWSTYQKEVREMYEKTEKECKELVLHLDKSDRELDVRLDLLTTAHNLQTVLQYVNVLEEALVTVEKAVLDNAEEELYRPSTSRNPQNRF